MRIATWNLSRPPARGTRTSALLAHMAAVQADVWVLTETRCALAPGDAFERVAISSGAPDSEDGECWTAIWMRRGIDGEQADSADPERTACARLAGPSGRALYVYGTVLPWLGDGRRAPLRGALAFAAALAEQTADWVRIREDEPDAILCVAGDLNQDLLTRGHYYGSAAGRTALRAALAQAGLVCPTGGEADPVAGLGAGRASIDHICLAGIPLSSGTSSLQVAVWPAPDHVGARLSDHHGVVVALPFTAGGN